MEGLGDWAQAEEMVVGGWVEVAGRVDQEVVS